MSGRTTYNKMNMEPYGLTFLHPIPAWAAAWWSVLLPGFGHVYVGSHLKGFVLMGWEAVINHQARLNLAIYHSILGQHEQAAAVLRLEWAIFYPLIYLFAIYDSYRLAVELSQMAQLEQFQPTRSFQVLESHPLLGLDALLKRNPYTAAFFSLMVGGLGHLYNLRMVKAAVLTFWQVGTLILSDGHKAIALTLLGRFDEAAAVLNYQWFLFWPSITLFNVVTAYQDTVELNKLYDEAWEYRLRAHIRNPSWPGPVGQNEKEQA